MTNEAYLKKIGVVNNKYIFIDAMNAARQDEREKMQAQIPTDSVVWAIPLKSDTVNSILTAALRFLSEDGMIALRDALIERTPKSAEADKAAALVEEIEGLKAWKESAISVTPPMQEIGKALGIPLGESIHDKILPGIERLKGLVEYAYDDAWVESSQTDHLNGKKNWTNAWKQFKSEHNL